MYQTNINKTFVKINLKTFVLIFLLISQVSLFAQITLEVRNVTAFNKAEFTAEIRVSIASIPTNVATNNVIILEKNYSTQITKIENLADGWQKITWIPNFSILENEYIAEILVSVGTNVAKRAIQSDALNLPQFILIYNNGPQIGQQVGDVNFGYVPVDKPAVRQVKLTYYRTIKDANGNIAPVVLDSVTHINKNFWFNWDNTGYNVPVPRTIISGSETFFMNLYFIPVDDSYQYDVFTFHYHGGAKKTVKLFANNLKVESSQQLKLEYPTNKERFTPCQNIQIKWRGQVPGVPVVVEANFADSRNWVQLGEVNDSVLDWQVPNTLTNNLQIRVSQKFVNSNPQILAQNIQYLKVNYLSDASRFLAGRNGGFIEEYDVNKNNQMIHRYNLPGKLQYDITNLEYINNDEFFVSYNNNYLGNSKDTIAIFSSQQQTMLTKYPFEKFRSSNFVVDNKNNQLYAIPSLGNIVSVINVKDGSIAKEINFGTPVQNLTINSKQNVALVSLLNGEYQFYNLPIDVNSEITSFKLEDTPISTNILVSPNKKYAAISCKGFVGTKTQVVLVDLTKGTILTILREVNTEIVGMGFDPGSTVLIFGNQAMPQILFYDLAKAEFSIKFTNSPSSLLTDLKYSPAGNSIVSTADGGDALVYRTFIKPEFDLNDSLMTIEEANVDLLAVKSDDEFVFNSQTKVYTKTICNNGDSPIIFTGYKLKDAIHFGMLNINLPDTIFPNQCKDFQINFTPKDTGLVADSIVFTYCNREIKSYISGFSKARNITFLDNNFDFGETCIGDTVVRDVEILRNNDNAPIRITKISCERLDGNIIFVFPVIDTILQANEILKVRVKIVSDTFGIRNPKIFVQMYNQDKYRFETKFKVKGIGTIMSISHTYLAFIPEIKKRTIEINNTGIDPLIIDAIKFVPNDNFRVSSSLPLNIPAKTKGTIEVEWYGNNSNKAIMDIVATPCLAAKSRFIPLVFYTGSSLIQALDTTVNPLDEATISLKYQNNEAMSYSGERFFESELMVNQKLFFPLRVESNLGIGKLISQRTENGRRYFTIRVDGVFDSKTDIVARVIGIPGLAEIDTSKVEFINSSAFWGVNVKTTTKSGTFKIDAKCPGRKILDIIPTKSIAIYPNPANEKVVISPKNTSMKQANVRILNSLGVEVYSKKNILLDTESKFEINTSKIPIGAYKIVLESELQNEFEILEGNLNVVR